VLINILISINTASTKPTKRIKNVNEAKNKALAYIEEIVQGIYTIEKDTKKAKKIKYFNRKSVMFVINQAAG
jgi:hypothetical protein